MPAHFDAARAMRILLEWLHRTGKEKLGETMVRHLANKTKDGSAGEALIKEFRRPGSVNSKWVVADAWPPPATSATSTRSPALPQTPATPPPASR